MTNVESWEASIAWSAEMQQRGLPRFDHSIDPAWFEGDEPPTDEGWSLSYEFEPVPADQGNPSRAFVRFAMPDAPHARLSAGARLWLFERSTSQYAIVEILGPRSRPVI